MKNYGIMRIKGISGTNGWRHYIAEDTKKQMKEDIRANGYTVVRIFSEKEIQQIKEMTDWEIFKCKKYTEDEIDFVCQIF